MNRIVKITWNGTPIFLNYSMEVMFSVGDKFGNIANALEAVEKSSREGLEAVRWFACQMANDGELYRREMGYDKGKMYTEQDFSGRMHPQEFSELRDAVVEAIAKGYQRELQNEEDEVDLGLAELNRKKDRAGK